MPSERTSVSYELVVVKDHEGEEVVVQDHRGVFLLVEFDSQKVGIPDRDYLDDFPVALISKIDAERVYAGLRELMLRRVATSIEQLDDLAVKAALMGVLDAIRCMSEESSRADRAAAMAKIVDVVNHLPIAQ